MTERDGETSAIDLDRWTPAGKATVDYAVELLRSVHPAEVRGATRWLLDHPPVAEPALITALGSPSAQAAAILLGDVGGPASVEPLLAAHQRAGEGLRSAARAALAALAERGLAAAADASRRITDNDQ